MGWTFTRREPGKPVLDFFVENGVLRWGDDCPHSYRVLDSALVRRSVFYAAVEQTHKTTGERKVWAAVILVKFVHGAGWHGFNHNFGWKDMDESVGPCESDCPEKILKLLTPTEYEHANDWRRRCWAHIEKRKAVKNLPAGTVLQYGDNRLIVEGPCSWAKTRTLVWGLEGQRWIMKRSQILASTIVSQPEPANA